MPNLKFPFMLLLGSLTLTACGQKGALYLPEKHLPEKQANPTAMPAEPSQNPEISPNPQNPNVNPTVQDSKNDY